MVGKYQRSQRAGSSPRAASSRDRRADGADAAGAAEFGDQAAAGLQRARDPARRRVRAGHPVQGRVREDRVEGSVERQRLAIADHPLQRRRAFAGDSDHLRRRIQADDARSPRRDRRRQLACATTKIQDGFVRARLQPIDQIARRL